VNEVNVETINNEIVEFDNETDSDLDVTSITDSEDELDFPETWREDMSLLSESERFL